MTSEFLKGLETNEVRVLKDFYASKRFFAVFSIAQQRNTINNYEFDKQRSYY